MSKKNTFIILLLVLGFNTQIGYTQCTTRVNRKDKCSYEVISEITFSKNVADKLWCFCWDMNNITRILAKEPVTIQFSEHNSIQTISYDYQFLLMRNYSEYERKQQLNDSIISFKLIKSECSIPFIPNLKNGYGTYTIKSNNRTTTLQYYQYAETESIMRDYYLNYIEKDIKDFFKRFESEFNKTLDANN